MKVPIKELKKRQKVAPILKGLATDLKDPKEFIRIEKELGAILKSNHSHTNVKAYVACVDCGMKRFERLEKIKSLGFKDLGQYMQWKKVHLIIKDKRNFQLV